MSETKLFKTSIPGIGPFCIEFEDGEILHTRQEKRQRLISASPELYAALVESAGVVCSLTCESQMESDRPWLHSALCEQVTTALKKAGGEQ